MYIDIYAFTPCILVRDAVRGTAPSADPSACNVLDPLQTRPVNAKYKC